MEEKRTFSELINGEKPVVVDFTATWCGPCKAMAPIIDDFKQQVGDSAVVLKVDIDRNPAAARHYGIQGVPTLAIFKNGGIVWRRSGVMSASELRAALLPLICPVSNAQAWHEAWDTSVQHELP